MYYSTTAQIIFKDEEDTLEKVSAYCDEKQIGETYFDEDGSLILDVEDDYLTNGKDSLIKLIKKFRNKYKDIDIFALGTIYSDDEGMSLEYECHCKNGDIKYRETDWDYNTEISDKFSYEEFEDESGIDIDEDEYAERVYRSQNGFDYGNECKYGDWEFID